MGNQCNDSDQEQVHAVPSRRDALIAGAALVAAPFLGRVTSIAQAAQGANTVLRIGSPAHAQAEKEFSEYVTSPGPLTPEEELEKRKVGD